MSSPRDDAAKLEEERSRHYRWEDGDLNVYDAEGRLLSSSVKLPHEIPPIEELSPEEEARLEEEAREVKRKLDAGELDWALRGEEPPPGQEAPPRRGRP